MPSTAPPAAQRLAELLALSDLARVAPGRLRDLTAPPPPAEAPPVKETTHVRP